MLGQESIKSDCVSQRSEKVCLYAVNPVVSKDPNLGHSEDNSAL